MTPSEQCKNAGLNSLAEFEALSTCSQRTLINWHKHKPVLFECVLLGAVAKQSALPNAELTGRKTWFTDGLVDWIDAEKMQPPLITGQDYSVNVWGYDATEQRILVVSFFIDPDGWHWANAYGDIFGDAEFDDDYDIKYWQPILIPLTP